jgi:hypothetical protein
MLNKNSISYPLPQEHPLSKLQPSKFSYLTQLAYMKLDFSRYGTTKVTYYNRVYIVPNKNTWPPTFTLNFSQLFQKEQSSGKKLKLKLIYIRQSVSQSVLVSGTHLGPVTNFSFSLKFPSHSCGFVILKRPLWQEDGSVICLYNCFWALPEQSLLVKLGVDHLYDWFYWDATLTTQKMCLIIFLLLHVSVIMGTVVIHTSTMGGIY